MQPALFSLTTPDGPLLEDLTRPALLDGNDFDPETLEAIDGLAPGESVALAGGAAPLTFVRRVA